MNIITIDNELIKQKVKGEYEALLLFGSYSRGDQKPYSDVDVIQIVKEHVPSYEVDKICFSVYTIEQLKKMAKKGSLFILHLLNEAQIIHDTINFLEKISNNFLTQKNYNWYRKELKISSKLLDVNKKSYIKNYFKLNKLSCYILRSYLYSIIYEDLKNKISFSINGLTDYFKDLDIGNALNLRNKKYADYSNFLFIKKIIERYIEEGINNEFLTIEALIINYYRKSDYLVLLGLRLLNNEDKPLAYGEIEELLDLKL